MADQVRFLSIEFATVRKTLHAVDHLGPEAVAAYVDGELMPQARERAQIHVAQCDECRGEIERQRRASARLRAACEVHIPSALLDKLQALGTQVPQVEKVEKGAFRKLKRRG